MGVMLSPAEDRFPTEEELARRAGLVPGSVDEAKFLEMRKVLKTMSSMGGGRKGRRRLMGMLKGMG